MGLILTKISFVEDFKERIFRPVSSVCVDYWTFNTSNHAIYPISLGKALYYACFGCYWKAVGDFFKNIPFVRKEVDNWSFSMFSIESNFSKQ